MPKLPTAPATLSPADEDRMGALPKLPRMTEVELARDRWDRVSRARRQLLQKLEAAKAALHLVQNPPSDDEPAPARLVDLAAAYLGSKRPDGPRLERELR